MSNLLKNFRWRFIGLLLNPSKAHTQAMAWAEELTQGSRALNGSHVPADLREPLDRTIFTASGKLFSGMTTVADSFAMTRTLFYPLFLVILNLLLNMTLMAGVHKSFIRAMGDSTYVASVGAVLGVAFLLYAGIPLFFMAFTGFEWKKFLKPIVWAIGVACSASMMNLNNLGQFLAITIGTIAPIIHMWLDNEVYNINRARALAEQEFSHSHTLGFQYAGFFSDSDKILQIEAGMKDRSKEVIVGTATGRMRFNGKSNSPVAGSPIILTVRDIQEGHLQVLGKSGYGKTTTLRSIASQIAETDCGMLVVDGKQVLAQELGVKSAENPNGILDYIITIEGTKNFALLEGLSPEERAEQILTVTGSSDAKKDIWDSAGGLNLYYAGAIQDLIVSMKDPSNVKKEVLAHFANSTDKPWNGFADIYGYDESFMSYKNIGVQILETPDPNSEDKHQIIQILECHAKYGEVDSTGKPTPKAMYIEQCVSYIKNKAHAGKDKINSSVEFTVDTWNSLLTQAEEMLGWAISIKSDIDITSVTRGAKIGVAINKKYAKAGILALRFMIAKTFKTVEKRQSGWRKDETQKQMYFICDEAQDVLTEYMVDKAATFRSLGCAFIISTQTESGLMLKLGKDLKETFKSHFSNKIWFYVDDKESVDSMIEAVGKTNLIRSSNKSGQPIDFNKTADLISGSAEFDPNHPLSSDMAQLGSFSLFGKMKRSAAKQISNAFKESKEDANGLLATYFQVGDSPVNALTHSDYEKLQSKGYALIQIKRAGYPRIDIAKMRGQDENGNIFQ